ncbi:hypothetical protein DPMN_088534 [Dreissena polymorpha]|uniref:Uncharacterized protein n=1 Tax=Dreissena polymorpha TaxID=45954 RepID=A0A9D4KUR0_DREPO|nr:hypothetical protein DPMN_088534 [Dreissena polymorpha]
MSLLTGFIKVYWQLVSADWVHQGVLAACAVMSLLTGFIKVYWQLVSADWVHQGVLAACLC